MRQRPNDTTLVYSSADPAAGRSKKRRAPRASSAGSESAAGPSSAAALDGIVRIWLERKGRNGKPVSIVRGLDLDEAPLATLASRLKRTCGTGGSAKNGEIIIQGDHRTRLTMELERHGYRVKLAGG